MAEDQDDLPLRKTSRPPDLAGWSVEELQTYIARLQAEIERAKVALADRQSVRGAAEALFKKS